MNTSWWESELDLKIIEKTSLNINEKSKYFKQYETNKNAIEKLKIDNLEISNGINFLNNQILYNKENEVQC